LISEENGGWEGRLIVPGFGKYEICVQNGELVNAEIQLAKAPPIRNTTVRDKDIDRRPEPRDD